MPSHVQVPVGIKKHLLYYPYSLISTPISATCPNLMLIFAETLFYSVQNPRLSAMLPSKTPVSPLSSFPLIHSVLPPPFPSCIKQVLYSAIAPLRILPAVVLLYNTMYFNSYNRAFTNKSQPCFFFFFHECPKKFTVKG